MRGGKCNIAFQCFSCCESQYEQNTKRERERGKQQEKRKKISKLLVFALRLPGCWSVWLWSNHNESLYVYSCSTGLCSAWFSWPGPQHCLLDHDGSWPANTAASSKHVQKDADWRAFNEHVGCVIEGHCDSHLDRGAPLVTKVPLQDLLGSAEPKTIPTRSGTLTWPWGLKLELSIHS